jgi:hypothetical protein
MRHAVIISSIHHLLISSSHTLSFFLWHVRQAFFVRRRDSWLTVRGASDIVTLTSAPLQSLLSLSGNIQWIRYKMMDMIEMMNGYQ